MRHNKDLDTLDAMRQKLQQANKAAAERLEANKYMSPKTANRLLLGAAALTAVALPAAALIGATVAIGAAAALGATVAVAALNKAKAVNMEVNREGFSGFIAKASVYLREHSDVYNDIKRQHEERSELTENADLVQYKQALNQEIAQKQQLAQEMRDSNKPSQSQSKSSKNDVELSFR